MSGAPRPSHSPTRAALLNRMRTDLLFFGRVCLPNMFYARSAPFHREIADVLLNPEYRKINLIAPRSHAKSSLVAGVLPIHHIFFGEGTPHKVVVLVSKTESHAIRLLQTIKDALNYSLPLRHFFGYWGEHSALVWKEREVVLKDNTLILARGTGQQVVGLKHINQRPTLIVVDDPEDLENTKTVERMEFNLRWLLQSLVNSWDPSVGRVVVVGTPQHQRCMVEVLATTSGWKTLRYKAIQDDGSALWPEIWPLERLLKEKESLESIGRVSVFYRDFQCQVVGDEDQLFKPEYLMYWEGDFVINFAGEGILKIQKTYSSSDSSGCVLYDPPRLVAVNVFMGVDPASSVKQSADYSTIVPIGVDSDKNIYVLPYFRRHVTPMQLAKAIIEWHDRYHPLKTHIETVGYQEMLRDYLRNLDNVFISGLETKHNPRTEKSRRLESLEPFFYKRKVYLRPEMSELRDELIMYPRAEHDDLLDGLYYATRRLWTPVHQAVLSKDFTSKNFGAFVFEAQDENLLDGMVL